jgi:hypothetical protein
MQAPKAGYTMKINTRRIEGQVQTPLAVDTLSWMIVKTQYFDLAEGDLQIASNSTK